MSGIIPIIKKELADHLSSKRFPLVFALVFLTGLSTAYLGAQPLAEKPPSEVEQTLIFLRLFTGAPSPMPSFIYFMSLFGPVIGMALGFDAVNREIASGSILRIMSNPVHRDSIINGKIIAGLLTVFLIILSVVGTVVGFDIIMVGFGPSLEGTLRILYFILASTLYVGLWVSISLLFSVIFRRVTTSALACLALWVFLNFFVYMIANVVAEFVVPLRTYFPSAPLHAIMAHEEVRMAISRISPATLYVEVANIMLNPEIRSMGLLYVVSSDLPTPQPLNLDESIMLAWPNISALLSGLVICLTLSYVIFMRKEIRPAWA